MKKLFVSGALVFASLAFANRTETKNATYSQFEKSMKVQNLQIKMLLKNWYSVEFDLPCGGGHMTVTFSSEYADGSSAFIDDLANAVNSGVTQGCDVKAQFGL
jgi:trans-aconitate methyltransferase